MPYGHSSEIGQVYLSFYGQEAIDFALGAELGAEVADGHVLMLGLLEGGL